MYSSGQNKVNVRPACNSDSPKTKRKKKERRKCGPVFLSVLLNSQVLKLLSSLAKRIQRPSELTGVTFDDSLIMHENLPRKQGLGKGLEQR